MFNIIVGNTQGASEKYTAPTIADALSCVSAEWENPEELIVEICDEGVVILRKEAGAAMPNPRDYRISVTMGPDWGCDHTKADGDAYAEHMEEALEDAFPGYEVSVCYEHRRSGDDLVDCTQGQNDSVREAIMAAWDSWCGNAWEKFLRVA